MNVYNMLTEEQKAQLDATKGRLINAVLKKGNLYYRVSGNLSRLTVGTMMDIMDVQDYHILTQQELDPLFEVETPEGLLILHNYP